MAQFCRTLPFLAICAKDRQECEHRGTGLPHLPAVVKDAGCWRTEGKAWARGRAGVNVSTPSIPDRWIWLQISLKFSRTVYSGHTGNKG